MNFFGPIFSIILGVFLLTESSFAGEKVNGSELRKLLVGKTAVFSDGVNVFFAPDGKSIHWRGSRKENGRYTLSDGLLCIKYSTGFKRCSLIEKVGNRYAATSLVAKEFKLNPRDPKVLFFRVKN